MVVQHWLVLLSCWDDPHHSLSSESRDPARAASHLGSWPVPASSFVPSASSRGSMCAWRLFHSCPLHSFAYFLPLVERFGPGLHLTPMGDRKGRPYSVRPSSEPATLVSLQVVLGDLWIAHFGLIWIEAR